MGGENPTEPADPVIDKRFGVFRLVGGDKLESFADEGEAVVARGKAARGAAVAREVEEEEREEESEGEVEREEYCVHFYFIFLGFEV